MIPGHHPGYRLFKGDSMPEIPMYKRTYLFDGPRGPNMAMHSGFPCFDQIIGLEQECLTITRPPKSPSLPKKVSLNTRVLNNGNN